MLFISSARNWKLYVLYPKRMLDEGSHHIMVSGTARTEWSEHISFIILITIFELILSFICANLEWMWKSVVKLWPNSAHLQSFVCATNPHKYTFIYMSMFWWTRAFCNVYCTALCAGRTWTVHDTWLLFYLCFYNFRWPWDRIVSFFPHGKY